MDAKYLCESWQGLLQQLVYLISRGYTFYHITYLPRDKEEKWIKVDEKLIEKYKTNKSKWQRSRLKNKGVANYFYIRWDNIAIILHTKGDLETGIVRDDKFSDIHQKPLVFKISDLVAFSIQFFNDKVNVKFDKETYEGMKEHFYDVAKTKNKFKIIKSFEKLNGVPPWAGIIAQKRNLVKFLVEQSKRHDVKITQKEFKLKDKRTPVKVWVE